MREKNHRQYCNGDINATDIVSLRRKLVGLVWTINKVVTSEETEGGSGFYVGARLDAVTQNVANLESNKEYTFTIWVSEGSTAGTNNLIVQIQDGNENVMVFEHEACKDIQKDGDITTNVPTSGSFAEWSTDTSHEVQYQNPKTAEQNVFAYGFYYRIPKQREALCI